MVDVRWGREPLVPAYGAVSCFTAAQLGAVVGGGPFVPVTWPANTIPWPGDPSALAFDAAGNMWVADLHGTVVEFSSSQSCATSPSPVVTISLGNYGGIYGYVIVRGMAFDASGNLWVVHSFGSGIPGEVVEYSKTQLATSGSPVPQVVLTMPTQTTHPMDIAFDRKGDMWVSVEYGLYEFTPAQLASSGSPSPAVVIGLAAGTPVQMVFRPTS